MYDFYPNNWGRPEPKNETSVGVRATEAEMRRWGVDPTDPEFENIAREARLGTVLERAVQELGSAAVPAAFNEQ